MLYRMAPSGTMAYPRKTRFENTEKGCYNSHEGDRNTDLECHRAMPFPVCVLGDVEPHQILRGQSISGDRVLLILSHIGHDIQDVENYAFFGAHGSLDGERKRKRGRGGGREAAIKT